MRTSRLIQIVNCHAEGEVGDVIVGGVAPPPGDSIREQARWIHEDGSLRRFVLNEPRGGVFRHVNLLVPAKDSRAQMGFIIMEPADTPLMSGSNSICVATVLLDTGIVPMREPVTHFTLEAPGGLVEIEAQCDNGKARSIRVRNLPSFVTRLDAELEVTGMGTLKVDIAFGGDSFVLVDAASLGFAIRPDEAADLAAAGARITQAANEQLGFRHPLLDWDHVSFCQFTNPVERVDGVLTGQNAVVVKPGKIDRSPTGTGCSARMAVLHAKGLMQPGDAFIGRSIIDTRFHCRLEAVTMVGDVPAIVPSVQGRAWVTGTRELMLDPDDPFPEGYRLGDTWPSEGQPSILSQQQAE